MKKGMLLFFLLTGVIGNMHPRYTLTRQNNAPRPGDEIVKQQVEYKDPGRTGQHVLWDFSKLNTVNESYTLSYSGPFLLNDSLYIAGIDTGPAGTLGKAGFVIGREHFTRYFYQIEDDGLFVLGHQNPVSRMKYEPALPLLPFQNTFGEKDSTSYIAQTLYSGTERMYVAGYTTSEFDSYGMMILPDKDTLRNVVRIRTLQSIVENADSLARKYEHIPDSVKEKFYRPPVQTQIETFRWYAKGYRYPIFETIRTLDKSKGEEEEYFATAFFYPPQDHYYLEDDPENLAELFGDGTEDPENPNPELTPNPGDAFRYNFYPNPVSNVLTVEYYTAESTDVEIGIFDMQGKLLHIEQNRQQAGIHVLTVDMRSYIQGNYLLKINTQQRTISEIIVKK